jgi:hypothetical protein
MEKSNITVIIPVHQLQTEGITELFQNALISVQIQKVLPDEVIVVVPYVNNNVLHDVSEILDKPELAAIKTITRIVEHDKGMDFASQVNYGVSQAKTEWVTILEYDDELANIWLKNVVEYRKAFPTVGLFMPIVVDVDAAGQFIGFTNEAVWANSFSDELGILDLNALLVYQNFNLDGIVIKKEIYEENGGIKPSIKLTFIYEFLLRMAFKDVRIMTIPRFGYRHVNQRPDSLFARLKAEIDPIEAKWWLSQAKKEYYFEKDRKLSYTTTK